MNKLAILLDSFSGYSKKELKELGIYMVSQTVIIDGQPYKEGEDITRENSLDIIKGASDIKSSMPAIGLVTETLKELSEKHEQVIYIAMNKGMSSTYSTGFAAATEYDNVEVINAGALITSMIVNAAQIALKLSEIGKSNSDIIETIKKIVSSSETYLVVKDTSKLIKSGRIGITKKIIMEKVKLIPRLKVTEEGLSSAGTKRNFQKIIKSTVDKIIESIGENNKKNYSFHIASSGSEETDTMVKGALNLYGITNITTSLTGAASLGHTGTGSFGVGAMVKIDSLDILEKLNKK